MKHLSYEIHKLRYPFKKNTNNEARKKYALQSPNQSKFIEMEEALKNQ